MQADGNAHLRRGVAMEGEQQEFVEVLVTPSGCVAPGSSYAPSALSTAARQAVEALASSQAEGVFCLATLPANAQLTPGLSFWQQFGRRYLERLCQTPELTAARLDPINPPDQTTLARTVASAPPMRGGEYLNVPALERIWRDLDQWIREQVSASRDGLPGFLRRRAPHWHQVGRVCFHLAENKRNPQYPFAFLATYIPGLSPRDAKRYQPLAQALQQYAGEKDKAALVRLLTPVERAAEESELVRALVDSGDIFHPLAWTPREAYTFLKEVPRYEAAGVVVRLPDWWHKRPRPQVGVRIGETKKSTLGIDTMLDFRVQTVLDGQRLSQKELRELLAQEAGLVLFKGRWVEVDQERLQAALDHWRHVERASHDGSLSFAEGMRLLAGAPADLTGGEVSAGRTAEWSFVRPGKWLSEMLHRLQHPGSDPSASGIPGLQAQLRPYQCAGVDWLWLMLQLGLGACLADDMGLGKTVQVLAALLRLKQEEKKTRPSLLVLPASLLANWKTELARFAPSLRAVFVHSSESSKEQMKKLAASPEQSLQGADIVLTTYATLQRQAWLTEFDWRLVVIDEAQAIKNASTRQARTVKSLQCQSRIALTGTPVENRLGDLWSLFDFLCPGLLGSAAKFKKFVKALEERQQDRYAPLRNLVRPYILRRLKTDKSIIADLPDKSEVKAYCGLTKRQAALYQRSVEELAEALEDQEGIKRRGIVLAFLMRFKQICNHPSQLLGDRQFRPADSGKFARISEICAEIASRQEKVLVFSQFREMADPLQSRLAEVFGRPGLVLHGGTAVKKRKQLIEEFQQEEGPPFFVLSLKAGGTGLNLTAASHVIHFDRWWNPAVENQATDRAFRIGQHRNVLVHKFVCRGTIEERIDALIEEKGSLAEDLLKAGPEKLLTEMTDQQLIDLVSLDIDKAAL